MLKVVMRCATFRQHMECVEQTYPLRSELIFYMAVNPSDYDVLNLRLRSFSITSFNLFFFIFSESCRSASAILDL